MHGRGAEADDLRDVGERLPAARVLLAQAPFPAAPWGYGPGRAWYRFLGDDRPEAASFATSLDALHDLVTRLSGDGSGPIVVGGFSQGGTLALGYALAFPGTAAAVLNFSGFLANHARVRTEPATAQNLPIFWGHGTMDPAIPFDLAEAGRAKLRDAGAALTSHDYALGHSISLDEIADAGRWLSGLAGPAV